MSKYLLCDCASNTPKILVDSDKNNVIIGNNSYNLNKNYNKCTIIGNDIQCTGNAQVQLGSSTSNIYSQDGIQHISDARDKTNIRDITLGLDFINRLHPVDYKWNCRRDYYISTGETEIVNNILVNKIQILENDGSKTRSRYHHGLIGQEVKEVMNTINKDFGGYQDHSYNGGQSQITISYTELIAPMIKAIQELNTEITNLKTRATILETRATRAETLLTSLEACPIVLENNDDKNNKNKK